MQKTVGNHVYKVGKLPAMKQFHVVRRLTGLLVALAGAGNGLPQSGKVEDLADILSGELENVLRPLSDELARMDDATAEFIIHTCLGAVDRRQQSGGWAPVMADGQLMFTMDMVTMLTLTAFVLQENLQGFFALPEGVSGAART